MMYYNMVMILYFRFRTHQIQSPLWDPPQTRECSTAVNGWWRIFSRGQGYEGRKGHGHRSGHQSSDDQKSPTRKPQMKTNVWRHPLTTRVMPNWSSTSSPHFARVRDGGRVLPGGQEEQKVRKRLWSWKVGWKVLIFWGSRGNNR